jgi:hypothetical protein
VRTTAGVVAGAALGSGITRPRPFIGADMRFTQGVCRANDGRV